MPRKEYKSETIQRQLADLHTWIEQRGWGPNLVELAGILGLGTTSGARAWLDRMLSRGYVVRAGDDHRTIRVIRIPLTGAETVAVAADEGATEQEASHGEEQTT